MIFSHIKQKVGSTTHEPFKHLVTVTWCLQADWPISYKFRILANMKAFIRAVYLIESCGCVWLFRQKHPAPEDWLYKEARALFLEPQVVDCSTVELKWNEPDEEGLIQFMCSEKQFR